MFRLTIRDSRGTRAVAIDRAEAVVGRREGADVRLEDGTASNNHCVLRLDEKGRGVVIDLGSAHGTWVNGSRVEQAGLKPGDQLRIGSALMRVDACGAPSGLALEGADVARAGAVRAPVPTGASHDFGREVRALLRRTPWYVISLFVHILAMLILDLVPFKVTRESLHGSFATVRRDRMAEIEADDPEEYEPDLESLRPPEPVEEDPEELMPAEKPGSPSIEESPPPSRHEPSHNIGTAEALARRIPALTSPTLGKEQSERIDRSNLEGEQGNAKKVVERGLGDGLRTIRGLGRNHILVIEGDFDKMERILDLYRIPFTLVTRRQFMKGNAVDKARMLCINCARKPSPLEKRTLLPRVRNFVTKGGWLITSDWALEPFLTELWPSYVKLHPQKRHQTDTTVSVFSSDPESPLLQGVFRGRQRTDWWLEETSSFFKVRSPKVVVLVGSDDMARRFGTRAVAITFEAGRGRVLHLLGHFYQKDGNRRGLVAMQRLILNYLRSRFAGAGG
ncbi:MAG: FHA domain-containing protein [Planctomycetota bacterium]|jgi:hypothetical protein